jgi:hypothetical protein
MTTHPDLIPIACLNLVSAADWSVVLHLLIRPTYLDVTLQQVRLQMAEEEKGRAEAGTCSMHDVTASAFLLLGMDIEGLQ